jgi:hypothetical protein
LTIPLFHIRSRKPRVICDVVVASMTVVMMGSVRGITFASFVIVSVNLSAHNVHDVSQERQYHCAMGIEVARTRGSILMLTNSPEKPMVNTA